MSRLTCLRFFWPAATALAAFATLNATAQPARLAPATQIERRADGRPELIRYERASAPAAAAAPAALRAAYELSAQNELRPLGAAESDALGYAHQKYQQYYQGVPVEFTATTAHCRGGVVEYVTGETRQLADGALSVRPALTAEAALPAALTFVGARTYKWELPNEAAEAREHEGKATYRPAGELVIVDNVLGANEARRGRPVLAWKFNIYAAQPLSRAWIYVDAATGEVVNHDAILKHATGSFATKYSGTRTVQTTLMPAQPGIAAYYKLLDATRGGGIQTINSQRGNTTGVDFKDANNAWTAAEHNNTNQDWVAGDAHFGAEMNYDYWSVVHGRNSFDGAGAQVRGYVHYDPTPGDGHGYDNAGWNGAEMLYGDGDTRYRALTSLDVTAHELGHAVCQYTANLQYQNESGALNEGFSDIWAACVEARTAGLLSLTGKNTWLIGEEIALTGGALRSMSDPNSLGQPDTYQGLGWWPATATPTGGNDWGGVHYNSGVLNYWFYLLSQGGAGTNDNGNAYSVTGIGIDKAARIAYLTEKLLSPTSNHASARTMAVQAATTLYGAASAETRAVTNAWYAVGVGGSIAYGTASPRYIAYVALGAYARTSVSDGGYSPASSLAPASALTRCVSATLSFQRGGTVPANAIARDYCNAYIDYNQDGDFTDADERVVTNAWCFSSTMLQASFTVPATALAGLTRMRVVIGGTQNPATCGAIGSGEVEEHFVNISTSLAAPLNLRATAVRSASAVLSWAAVPGAVSYKLQYRIGTGLWFFDPTNYTSTLQSLSGLRAGSTYTYKVTAVNSCGTSSVNSATITFTTAAAARPAGAAPTDSLTAAPAVARATGLAAPAATLTASAYPNPAQDVLRLTLTDGQQAAQAITSVDVFDERGTRVLTVPFDAATGTLRVESLRPGLYLATVRGAASSAKPLRFVKE